MKTLCQAMEKGLPWGQRTGILGQMLKTAVRLVLHPGEFYTQMPMERDYGKAMVFLFFCSLVYGALTALYAGEQQALVGGIAFVNAFLSPFLLAFLLYAVSKILCRNTFSFGSLMRIMAYAGVTLLVAWIPGMGWAAGIWRFCLVGLGMVKAGGISGRKAFAALACTVLTFLLMVRMLGPLAGILN